MDNTLPAAPTTMETGAEECVGQVGDATTNTLVPPHDDNLATKDAHVGNHDEDKEDNKHKDDDDGDKDADDVG